LLPGSSPVGAMHPRPALMQAPHRSGLKILSITLWGNCP